MTEIVAGIDRNIDRATDQANAIADLFRETDTHVTLVHWQDLRTTMTKTLPEKEPVEDIMSVVRAQEIIEDAGLEAEIYDLDDKDHDDAADAILSVARRVNADLISVSGRKRTKVGKVIFGSTTQAVILGADRPVITTGHEPDE